MHQPKRREFWIATFIVLVSIGITVAVAVPRPFLPSIFAPGWDHWFYMGPCAVFMDSAIAQGQFPLWNPLSFCGTPFAAHPESAIFYPLNLLRSLLIQSSTPFASLLSVVGLSIFHIILAGVGSFLLARAHGVSRAGATVASCVVMFNPTFLRWALELWQYSVCIAWAPVLMLLMKAALDQASNRRAFSLTLVMGLILGAGITAGFPQFFIHLCVAVFFYGMGYGIFCLPIEQRNRFRIATALTLPFLIAPLLAAVFLLPALEYASFIGRSTVQEMATSELFVDRRPLSMLKHFLLFTSDPGLEGRRVAGAGVLFLCFSSLFFRLPKRELYLWGFLLLVLLDCSIGRPMPLATLIDILTQSHMRLPSRLMPFACLPLGILAGMAVDALQGGRLNVRLSTLSRTIVLSVAYLLAIALLHHWVNELDWLHVSRVALWTPAVLAAGIMLLPYLSLNPLYRIVFPVLIFVELLAWNHTYLNTMYRRVDLAGFGVTTDGLKQPISFWKDNYRGAAKFPNAHMAQLNPSMTGFDPLYISEVRKVLSAPGNEEVYTHWVNASEITQENHRGHLFAKRSFWLASEYAVGPLPPKDQLFPPTTTVFVSDAPALSVPQVPIESVSAHSVSQDVTIQPLLKMEVTGKHQNLYYRFLLDTPIAKETHTALVLYFQLEGNGVVETRFSNSDQSSFVNGYLYSLSTVEARDGFRVLEIPLPAMEVAGIEMNIQVESDAPGLAVLHSAEVQIDQRDENHLIRVTERGPNHVALEVGPLEGHRILTCVDAAYPGWEATVDGKTVEVFTAQQVFKGIEVPPGTHRVVFRYRPLSFRIGLWISGITLLMIGTILIQNRRKNINEACKDEAS